MFVFYNISYCIINFNSLISIILLAIERDGKKVSKEELTRLMEDSYINEFTIYRSNILK